MTATFACQLLLPLAELATLWWLRRRIVYKRYPALLWCLGTEALWHLAGIWCYPIAGRWSQPFRMAMRAWVVIEVFQFACIRLKPLERARLIGEALTISGTAAWLTLMTANVTVLQNLITFRAYYHLVLAGSLWWLMLRLRTMLIAENRDHRAYRWGMTRWFSIVALCGLCVRGIAGQWISSWHAPAAQWAFNGFRWVLPPATTVAEWVWAGANLGGYALLTLNCCWLGYRMTSNISCLRPDVAFRGQDWMGLEPAAAMLQRAALKLPR